MWPRWVTPRLIYVQSANFLIIASKVIDSKNVRKKILLFLYVGIFFALPTLFLVSGGLFDSTTKIDDQFGEVDTQDFNKTGDLIELWFQILSFDPETLKAQIIVYPWPTDSDQIFSSSIVTKERFTLFIDELGGSGQYDYEENEIVGAITSEFDVLSLIKASRSKDSFYPLDQYVLDTYASVQTLNSDDSTNRVPTFDLFYTDVSVSGFQTTFTRIAAYIDPDLKNKAIYSKPKIMQERRHGQVSFLVHFERTSAVKLTVAILGLFIFFSAAVIAWISLRIFNRQRPPNMQALVWSAASVIGIVQLRQLYPNSPRIGIGLDFIFFFPSLIASLISSVVLTVMWVTREDFQI